MGLWGCSSSPCMPRPFNVLLHPTLTMRPSSLSSHSSLSPFSSTSARSCEYSKVFGHERIRPQLLERMPALDEQVGKGVGEWVMRGLALVLERMSALDEQDGYPLQH